MKFNREKYLQILKLRFEVYKKTLEAGIKEQMVKGSDITDEEGQNTILVITESLIRKLSETQCSLDIIDSYLNPKKQQING